MKSNFKKIGLLVLASIALTVVQMMTTTQPTAFKCGATIRKIL
jgi:hypothetical protein